MGIGGGTREAMHQIAGLIAHYGVVVVFLAMLLDQAGLPIPAFPTLMVAAALSLRGPYRIEEIVLALYARVGSRALLFAKFVPGLGVVAIALAGMSGITAFEFAVLDVLGAGLFVGTAVFLGVLFKAAIFAVIATLANLGALGLALAAAALGAYVAIRWWRRQAFIRQLRMDRISADELAQMIDRGETPVILDVRPDLVRFEEGIIPGAIFAHPLEAQQSLAAFSKDIEVVVYCSCPNEESAATAAKHLKQAGFRRIRPLLGGIQAWAEAGRAVVAVDSTVGIAAAR